MMTKRNKKRNNGDGLIPLLIFFVCGRWYTIPISECLNTYLKFLFDWMILKPNALMPHVTMSYFFSKSFKELIVILFWMLRRDLFGNELFALSSFLLISKVCPLVAIYPSRHLHPFKEVNRL
jgi:hypothetical protein